MWIPEHGARLARRDEGADRQYSTTEQSASAKAATRPRGPLICMTDNQTVPRDSSTLLPEPIGQAVDAAHQKKAGNLIVLDLRPSDAFTDYFLICSGRSTRQVKAIANGIEERLKAIGHRPDHVEGYVTADWVLIDCFDFVVHVFTPETRDFYALERLWGNAVRVEI